MVNWIVTQRKRALPGLVVLALLAGLIVSIIASNNARGDYYTGCGYGYGSGGTSFGYGTGYGYGYVNGSNFGYGYGNQVCPVSVVTTSLPGGTVGVSYSQTLQGTGGVTPYTWTLSSGSLPGGTTLSSGGIISGMPTTAQTANFAVKLTDQNGQISAAQSLSIVIGSGGGGGGGGTTSTSSTTTSTTTTTAAPSTTTTAAPPPKKVPRLFYIRVVNPPGATSLRILYHCLPTGRACAANAALFEPVLHHEVLMASARFSLGSGGQAFETFQYTKAGIASLGGTSYYHKKAVSLVTRVAGGATTVQVIFLRRWPPGR
jgi:hypothetical protein